MASILAVLACLAWCVMHVQCARGGHAAISGRHRQIDPVSFTTRVAADCPNVSLDRVRAKVVPDFDTERFLGRWDEILWVTPPDEVQFDATDYYHEYTRVNQTHILGYQNGRDLVSQTCFSGYFNLTESGTKGILLLGSSGPPILYYVLATDYTTFANVYGCEIYDDAQTTCTQGRSWLWARQGKALSPQFEEKVVRTWERLCLNTDPPFFKRTPQNVNECMRVD